jgi:hypothetical protein
MILLKRIRLVRHIARMRRSGIHIGFWWEIQKEKDYQGDLDMDGTILLKYVLKNWLEWYGLVS